MKKSRLLALLPACVVAMGALAWAAGEIVPPAEGELPSLEEATLAGASELEPCAELAPGGSVENVTASRVGARRAVTKVSDFVGKRVLTYNSRTSASSDGGNTVTITEGEGDTIVINNFWREGVTVKAAVNLSAKTVTIPNQVVMTDATYGDCDIAAANADATPRRGMSITGTFDDEGNITITTLWAIYVVSGKYADNFFAAGDNTLIEVPNGNMHVTTTDSVAYDWAVIVTQASKNLVTVKNFGDHGKTVEILLSSDGTIDIEKQLTWVAGTTQGDYYTYAADWTNNKLLSTNIEGRVTSEAITWDNWAMYSTKRYYQGKYADATITGIEFEVPSKQTSLDGSGTQADPFRIRTLDDLVYLADTVNNNENRVYGEESSAFARSFEGQYFVVENDIDMTNYRWTPIGADFYHRFAGVIDGQGHTLKGLYVKTGTAGFAALFGMADTTSVIKNLTLTDVNVSGEGYYAAAVAAVSCGVIENCSATGTISNAGVGTGGIVGLAMDVKNCAFEGTVSGTKGITGGVAGQTYATIDGCHAIGNVITGGRSDGYTGGGVVGTLYGPESKCLNSYFAGTVDGTGHDNLYVGGVVGQNYRGVIDGCFAVANVYGVASSAAVGGVVGQLAGDVLNSYATGYCQDGSSYMVGGITGNVRYYVIDGDTVQSSVKNCYTTSSLYATTYMYDSENEVRETLGQIMEGANPTLENIYFDLQMEDVTSKHYRALTSELTSASGPAGFPTDKWTFTEGYYPRLKAIADNDAAYLSASVLALDEAIPDNVTYVGHNGTLRLLSGVEATIYMEGRLDTEGHCGNISGGQYVLNGKVGNDTIVLLNPKHELMGGRYIIVNVVPSQFEGSGTESDPFQIKTKADLMTLGQITSLNHQHFNHVYFKQMNDIDMESDTSFLGLACPKSILDDSEFGGTYDGGGYTLHNVWLYYVSWTKEPTETSYGTPNAKGDKSILYRGFVGQLGTIGVVKNLTMAADCQFDFYGQSGAFVGRNYGLVENCRNYGTVRCYTKNGGGIVGTHAKAGTIRNCLNAGNIITGQTNCGGIAGTSSGVIENCMNVGLVEVKQLSTLQSKATTFKYAGGITGFTLGSIFKNVVNAGHIEATGGYAGGLFGAYNSNTSSASQYLYIGHNDTYTSLDYGTVFTQAPAYTGAIGGYGSPTNGTVENVYYDRQVTGLQASANSAITGVKSMNTAELTSGTLPTGFDAEVWSCAAGQYPVLKIFADADMVKEAAQVVLSLQNNETVKTLTADGTLSDGQWSLTGGTQFSIDGKTLKVPTVTSDLLNDTLCVTRGSFSTKFALVAVDENPLAGSGTEEDPFQIHDPATWDAFAHYMVKTGNTFADQYVKIMNDINFADTTFVPFAYDGTTSFNGHLLGNNATVSGINYTATGTYQGAIFILGAGATVSDLTLEGTMTTAKTTCGGWFGKMYGTAINCVNRINMEGTIHRVGGFAGYAYASAVFDHCVNYGSVSSTRGSVGGFAGTCDAGVTFLYCGNWGTISIPGNSDYAGGFVGTGKGPIYKHCLNSGTITTEKGAYIGGFQGMVSGTNTVTFIDCNNAGSVTGASSVGGLLGATAASATSCAPIVADSCLNAGPVTALSGTTNGTGGLFGILTPQSVITNCSNGAAVTSASTKGYVGGLWGYPIISTTETPVITVRNCYNSGDVSAEGVDNVAGLGNCPAYTNISHCYNRGAVTGKDNVAGLVNLPLHDVTVTDSWNAGAVTAKGSNAGGISGTAANTTTVERCFNAGNITAVTANAGGLGGQTHSKYVNCYNRGNVKAGSCAGGLVGYAYSGNYPTTMAHCYSVAIVEADDASTCGHLVGNSAAWSVADGNEAVDTYYATDWGTLADAGVIGTASTVRELAATTELPSGQWTYGDEYTFPVIAGMEDNACATAFAVAVVLREGDTYDNVTTWFNLGGDEDEEWVTWTSEGDSDGLFVWDGENKRGYLHDAYYGTMVLVAECDGYKAYWPLNFNTTTGLNELPTAGATLTGEAYYDLSGRSISEPEHGTMYIVVRTYSDGTQLSKKVRY